MLVASWQTAALLSLIFLQQLLFFCNAVLQSLTGIMLRATLIALVNAFLDGGKMWKSTCLSCYSSRFSIFTPCSVQLFWQENFSGGGFAVVYAGSKFAAVSSPKFVANSSYHITSLSMVLLLSNLQLGCHFLPDFFWAGLCEAETRFWCLDQLVFAPCLGLALLLNLSSPKPSGVRVEDSCGELLSNVTRKKCILSRWMMSRTWRNESDKVACVQVLEFDTGRLKTPIWKSDGCQACQGVSPFLCVNGECAIRSQDCKRSGGVQDCSLSIQLTWAGTDRRYQVFNSWYQINSLGQYSLYKLYTSLKDSLTKQYNSIFHWVVTKAYDAIFLNIKT